MGTQEDIAQIERRLRDLKVKYEQYFAGLEKREPLKDREAVARLIRGYSGVTITNTGQAFKLNQLTSAFSALNSYWTRVSQQIEDGTNVRDRFRLKMKERDRGEAAEANGAPPAAARAGGAREAGPARFRDGAEPGSREVQGLYEQLVAAKKRAGESTQGLDPQALAAIIKQQVPQITKRFGCQAVEFRVVVEEGKAKLKATPK
jgi:hypothetical protein